MFKKLLFFSFCLLALSLAAKGDDVQCRSTDSKSCGPSAGSTWQQGDSEKLFRIADCSVIGKTYSGIYDTLCRSCTFGDGSSNQKGDEVFATSDQTKCSNKPLEGDDIECQKDGSCSSCGDLPSDVFQWTNGSSEKLCRVYSCLAGPLPSTGVTENFCLSCGGSKKFVNSYGSGCANPTSGKCSRKTDWTDADCLACNANGADQDKVKASADKTQCILAPSISSIISSTVTILACLGAYLLF